MSMARHLSVVDGRSHDVIAFPRSRVEEAGMDMTTLGHEIGKAVQALWGATNRGDYSAITQHLSRLDAKSRDLIAVGLALSGDAGRAPAVCPDHFAGPAHGSAA